MARPTRQTGAGGRAGRAGEPAEPAVGRLFRFFDVTAPAVVLGSTQPVEHVSESEAKRLGIAICRRRGGGSAVYVAPGEQLWMEAFVPSDDALADHDVCHAAWWFGDCVAEALRAFSASEDAVLVHKGAMVRTIWSDRVCFAGLGPGEVTVGGRKVFGLSQRRNRAGAHFFGALLVGNEQQPLFELLGLQETAALHLLVGSIRRSGADLEAAVLSQLGRLSPPSAPLSSTMAR